MNDTIGFVQTGINDTPYPNYTITTGGAGSYLTFPSGHCCACAGVCYHIGGPWLCAAHQQPIVPPTIVINQPSSQETFDLLRQILKELKGKKGRKQRCA